MDPTQHYSPYHHPYYRVGSGVKDHHHPHHHQTVESAAQAAVVQSRILEMRKEKSRDAARSRRGKENHEFYELAKLLPLPAAITSQLDKASIIRLTISYLKLREFTLNGDPTWNIPGLGSGSLKGSKLCKQSNVFDVHQGTHILQSLDGFAFALGSDGRFLYISETVSIYLGLSQVEMTGSSFFDYVHQQDHTELAEILGLNLHSSYSSNSSSSLVTSSPLPPPSVGSNASEDSEGNLHFSSGNHMTLTGPQDTLERQFCIRMKSTLTKRGCQHFKSSGYRVVHVISHLRLESPPSSQTQSSSSRRDSNCKIMGLVALAIALPPPSVNELRLESDMFIVRLGLDFKIVHVEPRVSELMGYAPEDLIGRSLYALVFGPDVAQVRKCHTDLMHKGQVMSKYYRLMNKSGGYTWIQSCVTLINNNTSTTTNNTSNGSNSTNGTSTSKSPNASSSGGNNSTQTSSSEEVEQCIICINYLISGTECDDVVMDCGQLSGGFEIPSSPVIIPKSLGTPSLHCQRLTPKQSRSSHPSSPSSSPSPSSTSRIMRHNHQETHHHQSHQHHHQQHHDKPSPVTPGSPESSSLSPANEAKRRRFTSSPVRPWKSPSPPVASAPSSSSSSDLSLGHSHPSQESTPASSLLRHISVIRETPPILKPQVMAPAYHPHPHHHHPHVPAHHYHPLVDPYAAAYHLYKNGSTSPGASGTHPAGHPHPHHPWGHAYN